MDTLFGEGQSGLKIVLFVIVVLGLLALAFWLLRRFGSGRLGGGATRGRHPRLAVIDQATVDSRRRLVLIRRDNVEHLLIIGGPSDVVVEQNIVRAAAALRETGPARPPAVPRVPLGEDSMRPLQAEPTPPGAPAPRKARTADPLAELMDGLSRVPAVGQPAAQRRPPRLQPAPPLAGSMADAALKPATDQNLSEMAQRLEAALRRPAKSSDEARTAAGNPKTTGEQATPERFAAAPPSTRLDTTLRPPFRANEPRAPSGALEPAAPPRNRTRRAVATTRPRASPQRRRENRTRRAVAMTRPRASPHGRGENLTRSNIGDPGLLC